MKKFWKKKAKNAKHPPKHVLVPKDEDDVEKPPSVRPADSFSPTSLASGSIVNDDSNRSNIYEGTVGNMTVECVFPQDDEEDDDAKQTEVDVEGGCYLSKHHLEVLLTPRFLEEYEDRVEDEQESVEAERELRRQYIQQELDQIVATVQDQTELGEPELEPEVVEALGIAANKLAYKKKIYNVASCDYVYVPSVAYCILNGSLLEEASHHYFGKSSEFLIDYAAGLGSAVLSRRNRRYLELRDDDSAAETVDVGPSDEGSREAKKQDEVWAWSPTFRETASSTFNFAPPPNDTAVSPGSKHYPIMTRRIGLVVAGALLCSYVIICGLVLSTPAAVQRSIVKMEDRLPKFSRVAHLPTMKDISAEMLLLHKDEEEERPRAPFVPNLLYY